jgi:hypothetical protein
MDIKDIRTARDVLHETSSAELIIVSLFLLPILFGSWSIILDSFSVDHIWKTIVFVILLIVYIAGLLFMKLYDPPEEKQRRAMLHVKNRLGKRPGHRASFMAIREEVNKDYTNDFLKDLIEKNPGTFSTVKIKRTAGSVPGITLVEEELDNT